MSEISILYERDFNRWSQQQVSLIKAGKFKDVDFEHLIEELEGMGKSNLRELASRFLVLIAHLLKWQFQPQQRSSSWLGSITEQRIRLLRLLKENPSLKSVLQATIDDIYADAVKIAVIETKLAKTTFPTTCPYTVQELLNEEFYPNNESKF
jgi:hypothetical protein